LRENLPYDQNVNATVNHLNATTNHFLNQYLLLHQELYLGCNHCLFDFFYCWVYIKVNYFFNKYSLNLLSRLLGIYFNYFFSNTLYFCSNLQFTRLKKICPLVLTSLEHLNQDLRNPINFSKLYFHLEHSVHFIYCHFTITLYFLWINYLLI
jgi:hypothetical protein